MTYSEKLKDPRWQKLRLRVLERDKWTCRDCGAKDRPLHAHHAYYQSGLEPWEHDAHIIMCLCDVCHERRHKLTKIMTSYSGLIQVDLLELISETVRLSRIMYNSGNTETARDGLKMAISIFNDKINSKSFKEEHGEL